MVNSTAACSPPAITFVTFTFQTGFIAWRRIARVPLMNAFFPLKTPAMGCVPYIRFETPIDYLDGPDHIVANIEIKKLGSLASLLKLEPFGEFFFCRISHFSELGDFGGSLCKYTRRSGNQCGAVGDGR